MEKKWPVAITEENSRIEETGKSGSADSDKELVFQLEEKEKRAGELVIADKELAFQNKEKEKRAAELVIANIELAYQNEEKEKRATELVDANIELIFQNQEKEKRAAELVVANNELAFQNNEKEKRAAELVLANIELAYQNEEKEKRAIELVYANKELTFQNEEKGKRASELIIANQELGFQNKEKEKRAAELVLANIELAYQNEEKEKRAAELFLANTELAYQNHEKEKRATELSIAYAELESFNFISSHDLQEPLRKIQIFTSYLMTDEYQQLSERGKEYLGRLQDTAHRMQALILDLIDYSHTKSADRKLEHTDLNGLLDKVIDELKETIDQKHAIIDAGELCGADVNPIQFRQLLHNLIDNALKFSKPDIPPYILIKGKIITGSKEENEKLSPGKTYCHISIADNGIGFEPQYNSQIFEIFKHLNDNTIYRGTGIGLAIVKKIVENHQGIITAKGEKDKGATFDVYIPSGSG